MPAPRLWLLAAWAFLVGAGLAGSALAPAATLRGVAGLGAVLALLGAAVGPPRARAPALMLAAFAIAAVRAPAALPAEALPGRSIRCTATLLAWHPSPDGGGWGRLTGLDWAGSGQRGRPPPSLNVTGSWPAGASPRPGQRVAVEAWLLTQAGRPRLVRAWLRPVAGGRTYPLALLRQRLHQRVHAVLPAPEAGLAVALLLGEWAELDPRQAEAYRSLGLLHVLAVSGLHLWLWDRMLRGVLRDRARFLRLPSLTLLAALAGFGPAVTRAWAALLLRAGAERAGRCMDPWRLWSLALWLEAAWGAPARQGLGFVLSYAATGALLIGLPAAPSVPVLRALSASCAAFFGSMPWLIRAQGSCAPWSILLTPCCGLLLPPRILLSALALVPGCGGAAGHALALLSDLERALLAACERLPATPWNCTQLVPGAALVASAAGLVALTQMRRRPGIAALVALAGGSALWLRAPHAPGVAALPLGHGLGVLVAGQHGSLLFDLGSRERDARSTVDRVLLPELLRRRWPAPDWTVLSHGDADHAAGLLLWEARGATRRVHVAPGAELTLSDLHPYCVRVLGCRAAVAGVSNAAGPVLEVRRPRATGPPWRAVVLGDQFGFALRELRSRLEPGPVDVLVLPHHGRTTDGLGELLDHLRPRAAWASCGVEDLPLPAEPLCARRGIPLFTTLPGALGSAEAEVTLEAPPRRSPP